MEAVEGRGEEGKKVLLCVGLLMGNVAALLDGLDPAASGGGLGNANDSELEKG